MFSAWTTKNVLSWAFKLLPLVLVIGAFIYAFLVILPANAKLKEEVEAAEQRYTELEERFVKYEERVDLMNSGIGANITIRTQQSSVKDRMNDVEVTTQDQPFADDGLRNRAGVLRQYQQNSPVFGNANR